MGYVSVKIPNALSVNGIYTLFRRNFFLNSKESGVDVHDFPEIIYITSGSHRLAIDGAEHELSAGQIMVYAPGTSHKRAEPSNCSVAIVSFDSDSDALKPIYNRVITLDEKQRNLLDEIFEDGCRCFTTRADKTGDSGMVLTVDADERTLNGIAKRLELFLVDIIRSEGVREGISRSRSSNPDFDKVILFLKARIYKNLTVDEIAEGCSMSVSKLKYLFRDNYSGGVKDCFNSMKIEKAKELIQAREFNFSEIAEMLSFRSLHYFSRYFKKSTGMTPSEYLKRN